MLNRYSIWLEAKTLAELERISKAQDRAVGWLIRKAVEEWVKSHGGKQS